MQPALIHGGAGPGEWRAALRGLAENPLLRYFDLAASRAFARQSLLRRCAYYAGPYPFVIAYVYYTNAWIWQYSRTNDILSWLDMALVVVLMLLWLRQLQALWELSYRCLAMLGNDERQTRNMCLDDCLSICMLSNTEIAVAAIWLPLRRLLAIILVSSAAGALHGVLQSWAIQASYAQASSSVGPSPYPVSPFIPMWPTLFFPLWLALPIALASCTVIPCLALNWLAAGRGLRAAYLAPAAALAYVLYGLCWPYIDLLASTGAYLADGAPSVLSLTLPSISGALLLAFLLSLLWERFARRRPLGRIICAIGGPSPLFMLILMPVTLGFGLFFMLTISMTTSSPWSWFYADGQEYIHAVILGAVQSLGWASPQGLQSVWQFLDMSSYSNSDIAITLIFAAMAFALLGLLLMRSLGRAAVQAIEARRSGQLER